MPKEFSVTGVNNDGVEEIRLSSRTHRARKARRPREKPIRNDDAPETAYEVYERTGDERLRTTM